MFYQDPECVKAVLAKAESLYNICDFEHALVLFIRGKYLAPDSSLAANGIMKCKKTILNKISDVDLFFFSGSKYLFDFFRNEGNRSIDSYINDEGRSFRVTTALANIQRKSVKEEKKGRHERCEKHPGSKTDRMKVDKDFLKKLEKSIRPLHSLQEDPVK